MGVAATLNPMATANIDTNGKVLPLTWWVLAVAILGLVVTIRIRLLGIPLERDEGEYAYAGQLLLQVFRLTSWLIA